MVPREDLKCAAGEAEAIEVAHDNLDCNVIPIRRNEKLTGYFERDSAFGEVCFQSFSL